MYADMCEKMWSADESSSDVESGLCSRSLRLDSAFRISITKNDLSTYFLRKRWAAQKKQPKKV